MAFNDLRTYLAALEREGEVARVTREVDPCFEAAAVVTLARERAVVFENVRGSRFPLVGNLFGNYRKIEIAMGCSRQRMLPDYLERVRNSIPPMLVSGGPVQQNQLLGKDVDLSIFPVPTFNEFDGGPFIDAGIIVARDPQFGTNLSMQRLQLKGSRHTGIEITPIHHLAAYYRRAEEQNQPLEIAVVIGCAPEIYVASQVMGAMDLDEYCLAGALMGQPVELVQCATVDLEVPATAEVVLEGRILPGTREPEGPFGEFPGYYGPQKHNPVVEYTAIQWRNDAVFQSIFMRKPPTENVYLTAIPKAADLYRLVKECVAEVTGVYLTPGGCGKFHAVVSIKKRTEGEPKLALSAILSSRLAVKLAVVVDDDIDIYDPIDVEWAIATRSQFDLDSIVFSGAPTSLDPSASGKRSGRPDEGLTAKVGIDATKPVGRSYPRAATVPAAVLNKVRRNWSSYGIK